MRGTPESVGLGWSAFVFTGSDESHAPGNGQFLIYPSSASIKLFTVMEQVSQNEAMCGHGKAVRSADILSIGYR